MSDAPRNPFEHHHPHHEHDHGDEPALELDPAQQSLADALRVSFGILIAVMALLVVAYSFSNLRNVPESHRGVRLVFGRIMGEGGAAVLGPGGPYFAWPYPIQSWVFIPTAPRQIEIDRAFWIDTENAGAQTLDEMQARPLNPERDGFVLTGDGNIIHLRASVTYQVKEVTSYLQNVREPELAEKLVRAAAEQGLVAAAASGGIDDLYAGRFDRRQTLQRIDRTLEKMETGLAITTLSLERTEMSPSVRDAFRAVVNAEQEIARRIEEAREARSSILNATAGLAHRPLAAMIRDFERAVDMGRAEEAEQIERALDEALETLSVSDARTGQPVAVSGEVASLIQQARGYRTEVVERVRTEADRFEGLLPEYRRHPRIVLSRLWQDALEEILTATDIETLYMPEGRHYLELNRDPAVSKRRQEARLEAEEEAGENGGR